MHFVSFITVTGPIQHFQAQRKFFKTIMNMEVEMYNSTIILTQKRKIKDIICGHEEVLTLKDYDIHL